MCDIFVEGSWWGLGYILLLGINAYDACAIRQREVCHFWVISWAWIGYDLDADLLSAGLIINICYI